MAVDGGGGARISGFIGPRIAPYNLSDSPSGLLGHGVYIFLGWSPVFILRRANRIFQSCTQ